MRIALVTDWYLPRVGGIEGHVHALALRLRATGHDAVVLTPWPGAAEVEGVPVRRLDLPLVPGLGVCLSPTRLARILRAEVAEGGFDVVHGHMSFGSTATVAAGWAGARTGVPVLATFHSRLRGLGWVWALAAPALGWRRWPFRATAVSEVVADDLGRIMPEHPATLLPAAVDPGEWPGPPAPPVPGRLRLVTVGRLQRRKRVDALVRAVAAARRRMGTGAEITLEVLGGGRAAPALAAMARRLGVADAVRLLGPGGPDEVRRLLARGDVYVNAAGLESFGIAALEALCWGLPVVARSQGGVASFVEHGVNGLLVSSDEEMGAALAALATDPEALATLRAGAAEGIPSAFTWDAVLARHLALYEGLVVGVSAADRSPA